MRAFQHGRVIWPNFIKENTIKRKNYLTGTLKLHEFPQTEGTEYSKNKLQMFFKQDKAPQISIARFDMFWILGFLIEGMGDADQ